MMDTNRQIGVIGGGSWGTAIVKIISNNVNQINWWIKEPEIIENIRQHRHNSCYLNSVELDINKLSLHNSINEVIEKSDILIFCIPAAFLTDALKETPVVELKQKIIISAIKGIVPEYNLIISEYFNRQFKVSYENIAIVSGPSHAEEVALEKLTYLTIASQHKEMANYIASVFACRYIKTSLSEDVKGIEYTTVLKNVVAVANGICISLGYGDNFQAVLISNAVKEIRNFVNKTHPINRDINNSVYLGDLIVTTYSQFSRNRIFGNMIGKGYSVKFAKFEMNMVAEGYYAVKSIKEINQDFHVEMPVIDAVYNILYKEASPVIEIKKLSERLS